MRIVIQRTKGASVTINGNITAEFGGLGYVILLGIEGTDTLEDVEWLVRKVAGLRVFDDENGVMNRRPAIRRATGRPGCVLPHMISPFPSTKPSSTSFQRPSADP